MSWAYVWAAIFSGKLKARLFIPLILILGIIPDIDIFLWSFGVEHQSFTHSIFFWVVLFLPVLKFLGWKGFPYLISVLQHFVFGDFIAGGPMLFWPFSSSSFGFGIAMTSIYNVLVEIGGFLLAVVFMYFREDLRRLLSLESRNILMSVPLLALLASMLFFAVDWSIFPLIAYVGSSPLLSTVVLGHSALVVILIASTAQGIRGIIAKVIDRIMS
jgi:hypothetical protein